MPDWDEDSPQLRQNLNKVLDEIVLSAQRRECPTVASARRWQSLVMKSLVAPDARFFGAFRGESGLEKTQVRVGAQFGVDAAEVAQELLDFETMLPALIRELDAMVAAGQEPDADQLAAVLDLCAWVHAGWERIHPFANGSGRTARLWANCIAMRYGLPPFIRLRPALTTGTRMPVPGPCSGTGNQPQSYFDECLIYSSTTFQMKFRNSCPTLAHQGPHDSFGPYSRTSKMLALRGKLFSSPRSRTVLGPVREDSIPWLSLLHPE